MQLPRWTTVQESEFPWEREALGYVRELLPDVEPFRAWSNFEFIAEDGSINEVDLLVVSLHRIYLVEIKSAPGRAEGDAGTWTWTESGRVRTLDNPLLLANRKAKKLKSLLGRHAAKSRVRVPYVEAIVFLSHKDVQCRLEGAARSGVYMRADAARDGDPHVGEVLTGTREVASAYAPTDPRIDARLSRAIERMLDQAGIRPTQRHRRVGDYLLEGLLVETDLYQDWEAKHVSFEKSRRRIRIYPNALQSSETTRAERRRAAQREYRLLDGVVHAGILRVEGFTEHERGPALIFEHPPDAERLDFYLQRRSAGLDLRQRLTLVRQIAETVQYAHARRLYHRSMTPQSILVAAPDSDEPFLKIFNWQAGHSDVSSETGTRLTVGHIVKLGLAGEEQGKVYLAPELAAVGVLDSARLDVFSLGALAYHIVSGTAPAANVEELHEKLRRGGGLLLSDAFDGATEYLQELVQLATSPETSERPEIVDFLFHLDEAIAALSAPEAGHFVHPRDATGGDELEAGFTVRRRLGKGSTAVALLVERAGKEGVLKVALEPRLNDRLIQEGEVLRELRHQNVVELYDVVEVSGHGALFMAAAGTRSSEDDPGTYTLAQRIREEGRLSLDMLQRFGEELLGVVDHLEQKGISHRDLKPENIGIGQTPKRTLTLVLFDFSLSGTAADNIRAGTPPYLDPFLSLRKPARWDPYAERFAAAVTLYEMATGQLPRWGDGESHPALVEDEVTLDVEQFDPAVRDRLERFFRKALARDYGERYDNAEEMRRSWARIFDRIDQPSTLTTDPGTVDLGAALSGATEETQLAALPLSPRVLNALDRMGVHTLRELLALPRIRLYRNKGVGQRTVREIRDLREKATVHLVHGERPGELPVEDQDPSVEPRFWSVDLMLRRLLPRQAEGDDVAILRSLLGLDSIGSRPAMPWPAQQDVAEGLSCPRDEVRRVVEGSREHWSKDATGWMTPLRNEVATIIEKHGGVMTRDELIGALLAARGSAAVEADRGAHAGAVAYAALEVEGSREGARFILYRGRDHVFVVATRALADAFIATPATRAHWAEALGTRADELAASDPLLTPERALEGLLSVDPPDGDRPLPQDRLRRLAVGASRGAALSSRMELYPRGMPAARAVKLGAGSLFGPRTISAYMVQARIASRYPEAEALPGRPRLDELLAEAGLQLRWDELLSKYVSPDLRPSDVESSSVFPRRTTTTHPAETPDVEDAWSLERRIETVAAQRRFLILTVAPAHHARAEHELLERFELTRVSLDALLMREMRAAAEAAEVRWDVVLRADAADRQSRDWRNLQRVVQRAVVSLETEVLVLDQPGLLMFPGLLARHGQIALFDRLREASAEDRAPGFVLLVPADAQSALPVIDRVPLPVVLASDWARIPESWLHNEHRAHRWATAASRT